VAMPHSVVNLAIC